MTLYAFALINWMKTTDFGKVNNVLKIIAGYGKVGEMQKSAYGAKKKQIEDQFHKYVDPRYISDRFSVSFEGSTEPNRRVLVQ